MVTYTEVMTNIGLSRNFEKKQQVKNILFTFNFLNFSLFNMNSLFNLHILQVCLESGNAIAILVISRATKEIVMFVLLNLFSLKVTWNLYPMLCYMFLLCIHIRWRISSHFLSTNCGNCMHEE